MRRTHEDNTHGTPLTLVDAADVGVAGGESGVAQIQALQLTGAGARIFEAQRLSAATAAELGRLPEGQA